MRSRRSGFTAQCLDGGASAACRCRAGFALSLSRREIALRTLARSPRRTTFFGWLQWHAGASRFGQSDGNRLLRRASAMFAFTDVLYLLTHKLAGRCRWPLPGAQIGLSALYRGFARHCLAPDCCGSSMTNAVPAVFRASQHICCCARSAVQLPSAHCVVRSANAGFVNCEYKDLGSMLLLNQKQCCFLQCTARIESSHGVFFGCRNLRL